MLSGYHHNTWLVQELKMSKRAYLNSTKQKNEGAVCVLISFWPEIIKKA